MLAEDITQIVDGLVIQGEGSPEFAEILTPEALAFVANLIRRFGERRRELLRMRDVRQAEIDAGIMPDFLPESEYIRQSEWTVAPIPADLEDRRVEITGPVNRKMVINALNSGASVFMADFEDSHSPTWVATIEGQINLRGAVDGLITYTAPNGKYMPTPNQIFRKLDDYEFTSAELLTVPEGSIIEEGLRLNVDVGIQYLASWLSGNGCVPIYNLMEDAATAEISRSQVWQWLHNPHTHLEDGRPITPELFHEIVVDVLAQLKDQVGEEFFATHNYELAARLFEEISLTAQFTDFLTITAYEYLD